VSRYAVHRLGRVPFLAVEYTETVDLTEPAVRVTEVVNGTIVVPAWAERTELVGCSLRNGTTGAVLGTILTANTAGITIDTPIDASLVGSMVTIPQKNAHGVVAHRLAGQGRVWETRVHMEGPGAARAQDMLGTASVTLVAAALSVLGVENVTTAQIQQAILSLNAGGMNLDSLLTAEGEKLELDRRAGLAPYAWPIGAAPGAPSAAWTPPLCFRCGGKLP
jgi:hypothetical protein